MTNINDFIKAKEESIDVVFMDYDRWGNTEPIKDFLSQSLLEYNEKIKEMCEDKKKIIKDNSQTDDEVLYKEYLYNTSHNQALDDIITNLTTKE